MTRARAARRLATAAAYGGGGLGVLGGALYAVMRGQAAWARRTIGNASGQGPPVDGTYGAALPGEPLSVLLLGDSGAAGYGMQTAEDAPGGMLGVGLSHIADRPVRLTSLARVGAQSSALDAQIDQGLAAHARVAVIVVGANDVTHSVRPAEAVRRLDAAVRRLHSVGCEVVVGTCPDLGTVRPVPHPLRLLARQWSRRLAAAQTIAVVEAGGRSVSLGALLGPSFDAAPSELFGPDRFHPSAAGYASMVAALLPSVSAALGVWDDEDEPSGLLSDTVLPISFAAAAAVREPGTEVAGPEVAGHDLGPGGRWVRLRRRVGRPAPAPIAPR
ncbi:MAG: SGNH/GDSL hydrolase family protein [Nocardioidaceae bacterium]|nr:SGNH/GDSL hydrolase family protein [Nocardioidaceae bacterium]